MGVNDLLCVRSSEVFSVYPKILSDILQEEIEKLKKGPTGRAILLPSDFEFKQKSYFRLLEKQRRINAAIERGEYVENFVLIFSPSASFFSFDSFYFFDFLDFFCLVCIRVDCKKTLFRLPLRSSFFSFGFYFYIEMISLLRNVCGN